MYKINDELLIMLKQTVVENKMLTVMYISEKSFNII